MLVGLFRYFWDLFKADGDLPCMPFESWVEVLVEVDCPSAMHDVRKEKKNSMCRVATASRPC